MTEFESELKQGWNDMNQSVHYPIEDIADLGYFQR